MQAKTTVISRQSILIEMNVRWLRQALRLLDRLDNAAYSTTPRGLAPHRAGAHAVRDCFMESSISRELQALSSHTVHHFALIAMTLRMHGVETDADFGMAPSTLRYLASKTAEAA